MNDIPEALGSAIEGGLLARAVEQEAGGAGDGVTHEQACLNCGTQLTGPYCHACGQQAHVHRSIAAFLHDLVHGALHFEGKIWHTLPMLAWQPGKLSRRYIDGERARFVSPMALFLFSVFLMFAVFQMLGLSTPTQLEPVTDADKTVEQVRGTIETQQAALEERLAAMPENSPERAEAQAELDELLGIAGGVDQVERFVIADGASFSVDPDTGVGWIDKGLKKWRENPGLMLYKLQANFYKFSWLLIPLSIPFVYLMFAWKRRFNAYDHAIFVTYSLSFVTLLFITLALLGKLGVPGRLLFFGATVLPLWHMHRQLKGTYEIGNRAALWRVVLLALFIVVVLTIFLQLLILLGMF